MNFDILGRAGLIAAIGAILLGSASCVEIDETLGENFIPTDQIWDVYTPEAVPFENIMLHMADSLSGYSNSRFTFGSINDGILGTTIKSTSFTLVPIAKSLDFGTDTKVRQFHFTAVRDTLSMTNDNQLKILQNVYVSELKKDLDTNVMYAGGVSARESLTADSKLTVDDIYKAARYLKIQNAPKINGSYVAIIHPDVAYDLMRDNEWIDAHKYSATENLFNGEIGKIGGVRFVETSEAKIFKNTPVNAYSTLVLGANAYGVTEVDGGTLKTIIKPLGSSGANDPLDQRATIGWKASKCAVRLMESFMIRIESASSFNSTEN